MLPCFCLLPSYQNEFLSETQQKDLCKWLDLAFTSLLAIRLLLIVVDLRLFGSQIMLGNLCIRWIYFDEFIPVLSSSQIYMDSNGLKLANELCRMKW